jgi:uncharacterized protein YkwD
MKYKLFVYLAFFILLWVSLQISYNSVALASKPVLNLDNLKQYILSLINQERTSMRLRPVELDDFASKVAENHAQEMLKYEFTSHWNRAGLKPYMRYSYAGGVDAVQENVAGKWSNSGLDQARIPNLVEQLHLAMFNERPPNDHHRVTILQPQHTHVGLAFSFNDNRLQIDEEFVAHYVEIEPIARKLKLGQDITIRGELLYEGTDIHTIDVFYEPLPEPMTVNELNRSNLYSFPKDRLVLRPKLADGYSYPDQSTGSIDVNQQTGKFSCQISSRGGKPGLYTLVVWVKHEDRKFPATNICIEIK